MIKSYMIVGASMRALFAYAIPMLSDYSECAKITSVFDPNPLRIEAFTSISGLECPSYTDFDEMLVCARPDRAIIATIDSTHHEYIVRCLLSGVDVIVEKPMTIDAERCRMILDAEKQTERSIIVAFNCRHMPYMAAIKRVISDGTIGRILHLDYAEFLDTRHGADYFRRWHRRKENSGGLLVHKSTHHFDLVNWWVDADPEEVTAFGCRKFYGPTRSQRGERCLTCEYGRSCEFYFDIDSVDWIKELYRDCEEVDGYYRDGCVFADDIDIHDTATVNVRYANGALLNYSLVAYSPYEGWNVCINGTGGRIEAGECFTGVDSEKPTAHIDVYDRNGGKVVHILPAYVDGHGGGDFRLLNSILRDDVSDPLRQQANSYAGAMSLLVGVAAGKSIAERRMVRIDELITMNADRHSNLGDVLRLQTSPERGGVIPVSNS